MKSIESIDKTAKSIVSNDSIDYGVYAADGARSTMSSAYAKAPTNK